MSVRLYKPWSWFWGLLAASISGGAQAFTTGPVAALFAPSEFNLQAGLTKLLYFMLIVFLQAGLVNAMFYLAKAPVPELIENGSGHTEHLKKDDMKNLMLIIAVSVTVGLLSGCVASRVLKPYTKETTTTKDGTVRVKETSADEVVNGGLDAFRKAVPH